MKILICAAGSGGHIYPALSLASSLRAADPQIEIIFISGKRNIDKKIFEKTGYKVFSAHISAFCPRAGTPILIFFLKNSYFLVKFIVESFRVLVRMASLKPDTVVGFGGIGSVPAVIAAKILGIPVLLHEQNLFPGRANKFLSFFAAKIAVGFDQAKESFKNRSVVYTGNPLRDGLAVVEPEKARRTIGLDESRFTILVFGGSQGSEFVNNAFIKALGLFSKERLRSLQLIHITGSNSSMEQSYRSMDVRAKVLSYCLDMSSAYSAADVVIARAGAGTVTEISYFGRAAVFIPYPYAGAHQLANARYMADRGAALIVEQGNDCAEKLHNVLEDFFSQPDRLKKMALNSRKIFKEKAADELAAAVIALANSALK